MKNQLSALEQDVEKQKRNNSIKNEKISDLQKTCQARYLDIDKLNEKVSGLNKIIEQQRTDNENLKASAVCLNKDLKQAESDNENLKTTVSCLNTTLEQSILDNENLNTTVANLNTSLEQSKAESDSLNVKIADLNHKLEQLKAENEKINALAASLNSKLEQVNSEKLELNEKLLDIDEEKSNQVKLWSYWKTCWKKYLNSHADSIEREKKDLKLSLDKESKYYIDYFVNLYSNLLFNEIDSQNVTFTADAVWNKYDISKMEKMSKQVLPEEFIFLNSFPLDIIPFQFISCFGVNEFPVDAEAYCKGADVIDGGAFLGDSAVAFSKLLPVRKVYAFEPMERHYNEMLKVLDKSGVKNVVPVKTALWNESVLKEFSGHHPIDPGASLQKSHFYTEEFPVYRSQCITTTIDVFVDEQKLTPKLIKLDVEGAEKEVLSAAEKTIRKYLPLLIIAVYHHPKDFFDIKPWLASLNIGYKFMFKRLAFENPTTDLYLLGYPESLETARHK
ncbi:FkbM family methyltransferase [Lentisphaerota bacterium ZTH]|nr:FkbM family methyltransferase [Lentisphaerota bacterium]WET06397.1 FkbM family methyltransferase [Lentisphaerota bacterium ZTH]